VTVIKQKLLAFAVHLGIGLVVVLGFLVFCWLVVYTPPILQLEGGQEIALIILAVDVTLGPLLTLILYRKGKPGLKLDIVLILVVQLGAFAYGAWTLWSQRPLFLTFVIEHFRIITAADIDPGQLRDERLAPGLFTGPRKVYVEKPTGEKANEILFEAMAGGKDIEKFPQYYRPFAAHLDAVREHAWTLARLREERSFVVETFEQRLQRMGKSESEIMITPIIGHSKEWSIILDRADGKFLAFVDEVIW